MADLILELFSEEIPARMQVRAEAQLGEALGRALTEAGLGFAGVETCSGPRRLTVHITDLPERSADISEERKGPRVGAPEKALQGFLRGAGLSSIDAAQVREDPKKGAYYVAITETPGRATADIIAKSVPEIIRNFHWPKSMRWGTGELRWVRPLQRILCLLDDKVVPFTVDGIDSGNLTEGHRIHGRGPYAVKGFADYRAQLEGPGHVLLDRTARRTLIAKDAAKVAADAGFELVEDNGLLDEVAGLAEWPVALLGDMDPTFLELPPEVIRLSMRTHQKYFAVCDPKTGNLAPHFVVVGNVAARDGGLAVAAGNAKVLSARLEDARFFWENDKTTSLTEMAGKLSRIEFKKELGSIADKVGRIAALARAIAPKVGADPDLAERAAKLSKADLVSEMVYEFPELQGVMGRYYAKEAGEDFSVADAIAEHYQPQGPSEPVPTAPISVAVALADKLDTLVGFWAIDEKPTGSKDPFALRRAALGVVRIILENGVRLALRSETKNIAKILAALNPEIDTRFEMTRIDVRDVDAGLKDAEGLVADNLLSFFADRLKVYLRDKGERHDLIDAVFALATHNVTSPAFNEETGQGNDDLVLITKRVQALGAFLDTDDGVNLLAGHKRALNILRAEEKKDGVRYAGPVETALLSDPAERALYDVLMIATDEADHAVKAEEFAKAMSALAKLRRPVDEFFESVTVNTDDTAIRRNRLLILAAFRDALRKVADFTKIEG